MNNMNRSCSSLKNLKMISLVIPCYNEEECIETLVAKISELKTQLDGYKFQAVFVNDGSTDSTLERLKNAASGFAWMNIVNLSRNFGKEAALTAGLDYASGDAIVFMDADLQHPPSVVVEFVRKWEQGACVVAGRRRGRDTDTMSYAKLAAIFYRLHNKISDIRLPENVGDFRLIDSQVASELRLLKERQRFMKGLFAWVGFASVFVDYSVEGRSGGKTSFSKWRSWNFAVEGITSFSTVPLRVWSYIGGVILFFGVAYSLFIVLSSLASGVSAPGYVTLFTAIVVFSGVQLVGIGILGEYLGRIYMEVKGRPTYVVSDVIKKDDVA